MSLPAPLMFTVGLIDQITKPIAKISGQLNGLASNYQAGTMQMATGVAGIAASGYALQGALMPAIEMDRALGEVKSLGVRDSALKMLTQNSYQYALKYGESATAFVRSSYDIQSAIGGLNDADLSRFTMSSNILAKATKADAATVTNYMGTMYGIFKNDAQRLGEGAWVERLTGMTATAVEMFKTDGKKMSDAFGALGASAGLAPLQEQMAILGTLQSTMGGSESATKYRAFLAGVGKAQSALNLQFTDTQGNMLPMIDILNKIKGKYGDVINVAEGQELTKAFGSDLATQMIGLLLKDVDALSGSINKLGQVKGMEQAEKMAAAMVDQSQRLTQSWFVIRAAMGSAILPAFNNFVGKIAEMGSSVMWFTEMFPNITRWLGYIAIAFTAAVAMGGLFNLMLGAGKMAIVAWSLAVGIAKSVAWLYNISIFALHGGLMFMRGALFASHMAMVSWNVSAKIAAAGAWLYNIGVKALSASVLVFNVGLSALRNIMFAVNAAMYANPIGLIVLGVVAAIAAVGALVYYWDDLKATMSEWGWVKAIYGIFSKVWNGIKDMFTNAMRWIIDKLSYIGIDIQADFSTGTLPQIDPLNTTANVSSIEAVAPVKTNVPRGGISQQIANANNSKSTHVGNINVYPQKVDADFANLVEMNA